MKPDTNKEMKLFNGDSYKSWYVFLPVKYVLKYMFSSVQNS